MYEHRYKHGKQTELLSHKEFCELVEGASLKLEHEAYIWVLYYSGVRKSEAYELVCDKCSLSSVYIKVDFGERKKHGAEVAPLEFPIYWPGVDKIIEQYEHAKRKRPSTKKLYFQIRKNVKASREVKEKWLFPHVQSTTAWSIVKKVLGPQFYPHYLRLNRLSQIGTNPEGNIVMLKSWSGIKSIKALESYMGISEREQKKAREFLSKQFQGGENHD